MNDVPRLPSIDMYRIHKHAMPIKPGKLGRQWMDQTSNRFAYRCTPLNMANTSGWTACCPMEFTAEWDGRPMKDAIAIESFEGGVPKNRYVSSHFGHGILTFHLGWLIKTSPGWAIWARGCPNLHKSGAIPLDGIVETDWLEFPFTMNWRFPQPGRVKFNKGDPVCFFTPFQHAIIDNIVPTMHDITDFPSINSNFSEWRDSRSSFNTALENKEPDAMRQRWQKKYLHAEPAKEAGLFHVIKRNLHEPVWLSSDLDGIK